jgi:hypothetical protein
LEEEGKKEEKGEVVDLGRSAMREVVREKRRAGMRGGAETTGVGAHLCFCMRAALVLMKAAACVRSGRRMTRKKARRRKCDGREEGCIMCTVVVYVEEDGI